MTFCECTNALEESPMARVGLPRTSFRGQALVLRIERIVEMPTALSSAHVTLVYIGCDGGDDCSISW